MTLQLRGKTHESIVYIDRDSAPRIVSLMFDRVLARWKLSDE